MRDIAFMAMFASMMLLAVRYLFVSTTLWIWIALCAPSQYLYGIGASLPLNKIVVAVSVVSLVIDRYKRNPYIDTQVFLIILFIIQGVTSYFFGLTDTDRSAELLEKMIKVGSLCLIMTMANRERIHLHTMAIIVCFGMGIHSVLEGLKYIASGGGHIVYAPASIGDNNYLAMASLMTIPFMIYMYRYSEVLLVRLLFLGMALAATVGVIGTSSRTGLIGLSVLGIVMLLQSSRKVIGFLVIASLCAGVWAFAPAKWTQRMDTISDATEDTSFMSRVSSWKMNTILALDRPLLGGGYSALEDESVFERYAPLFHTMDYIIESPPPHVLAAHSIYFETLGDLGFPGLFLFLGILAIGFLNCQRIRRATRGIDSLLWARDFATTLRACLVVYIVCGITLSAAYFEMIYILLMFSSMLHRHVKETSPARADRMVFARPAPLAGAQEPARP